MGHATRPTRPVLTKELLDRPREFSFSKAVELIQLAFGKEKLGLNSFAEEPFLFRANPTFGFPSSDIDNIYLLDNGRYEVVVNFMGLYGPASPLPDYFTQEVIDEQVEVESLELTTFYLHSLSELKAYQENRLDMQIVRKRLNQDIQTIRSQTVKKIVISQQQVSDLQQNLPLDDVLSDHQYDELRMKRAYLEMHHMQCANQRDFLDLFNHRLVTLYLEATRKYHPYQTFNLPEDYNLNILYSLIGAPSEQDRQASPINWEKLTRFSGLLSLKQGSGEVIRKVVAGYFDIDINNVKIEEGIYREIEIQDDQLNRLGVANCELGSNFLCGSRVGDRASKFRLKLLDLERQCFYQFLPITKTNTAEVSLYDQLKALLAFIKSPEQTADIGLYLSPESKVQFNLSQESPTMLGYSSWLNPKNSQTCHVVI